MPSNEAPTQPSDATMDSPSLVQAQPLSPDQQFGSARLVRRIGTGGMGEVWLARHQLLGRDVAIKFLLTAAVNPDDPAFQTFIQGAKVAASVEHPSLNKVFHADVAQRVPFLVLEFLDGSTLAELLARSGPLSGSMVRAVIEPVCDAVAELHHRDLLHRDIKPSNIMLTTDGRVVLTDFGLARTGSVSALRSNSGGVAGTPAYMAPEMFAGTVSARTDVYAIGMTAYYLLCGKPAFSGSFSELRTQHQTIPINTDPLRAAGVSEALIDLIVRATSKDILFRPKTARHLLEGFRTAFTAADIQPAPREALVQLVHRQSPATHDHPSTVEAGRGSTAQTLAEFAARKHALRPPMQVQPVPVTYPSGNDAQSAQRGKIWVARVVASAVGSVIGILGFGFVSIVMLMLITTVAPVPPGARATGLPPWIRELLAMLGFVTAIGLVWLGVIAISTLIYRAIRGKILPRPGDNTRCGWCQYELCGITTAVCSECGHRIGDQGPDQQGQLPPSRRWPRRLKTWLLLPACVVAVFIPLGLVVPALMALTSHYLKPNASMAALIAIVLGMIFELLGLFGGMLAAMKYYESMLQFKMKYSGRAWCRECRSELRELVKPICPTCGTAI